MLVQEETRLVKVFGEEAKPDRKIKTQGDLELAVEDWGLSRELIEGSVSYVYSDNPEKPLSAEDRERFERVNEVYAMAEQVWGRVSSAQEFMRKRHPMLDDRTPFEASFSELGARQVENILLRLYFGIAA